MIRGKFRSRSEHTLDAKGRLNIPSRFREALRKYDCETLMLVPIGDRIRAYPLEIWEEIEEDLVERGRTLGEAEAEAIDYMLGGAEECPLDKQGRILLKPKIREDGSIPDREIMLTGMVKWFDIQDRALCESILSATKPDLKKGVSVLSRQGIF